mmetsp:Transcript_29050/g.52622  ORF Transcript_29050/g.52622 Transcript_29050/m.52622 type:complete len:206 (+) Transcript_29050:919-1536(+)
MRRVRALNHRGELGVAHAGLLARGAHGARADAHLHNVGAAEDELLGHLVGDHVPGDDRLPGEGLPVALDAVHKVLAVPVGHVQADEGHIHLLQDCLCFLEILLSRTSTDSAVGENFRIFLGKLNPLFRLIMLVQASDQTELIQRLGHLKSPHCVHVCSHYRDPSPSSLTVQKGVGDVEIHLRSTPQSAAFWTEKHVLEIELDVIV